MKNRGLLIITKSCVVASFSAGRSFSPGTPITFSANPRASLTPSDCTSVLPLEKRSQASYVPGAREEAVAQPRLQRRRTSKRGLDAAVRLRVHVAREGRPCALRAVDHGHGDGHDARGVGLLVGRTPGRPARRATGSRSSRASHRPSDGHEGGQRECEARASVRVLATFPRQSDAAVGRHAARAASPDPGGSSGTRRSPTARRD